MHGPGCETLFVMAPWKSPVFRSKALKWHAMPAKPHAARKAEAAQDEDQEGFGPLTIPEAKAGLALGLGVPETAIEITVKF